MNQEIDVLTGVIQTEIKPIVFSTTRNNFSFTFMTDMVYSMGENNTLTEIPVSDGFIYGKTHDSHDVAIYIGNKQFKIVTTGDLNTVCYVRSIGCEANHDIRKFKAIRFCGGTLNNVFDINGMNTECIEGRIVISNSDDALEYIFDSPFGEIIIRIESTFRRERSAKGNSINNTDVILTLKFNTPQPLQTLFEHYNKIKDLLSFLTFRENVGFDKISLLNTHPAVDSLIETAVVNMRNDYKLTQKDYFSNISFNDLGSSIPNLLKILYNSKDEEYSILFGYLPHDDDDRTWMNDQKIKAICSALECELCFAEDIDVKEKELLKSLIVVTKKCIKEFRNDNPGLSNDTYNLIFSSVGNWSKPLNEKLCALYHKYENEINVLNMADFVITDDHIKAFVKYRNHITHGRHRTADVEIGVTAFYMCGLIYCCILERIGVSREKISELCIEKILS